MPLTETQKKKEEKRIYDKAYRKVHRERKRAYSKAYRLANKEKIKAYAKAWGAANRQKRNAHARTIYKANPEPIKERSKVYYRVNKKRRQLQSKIWAMANPEKLREQHQKRRAQKLKAPYEPINDKKVYLRDGWICQHCKKRVNKRLKWPDPLCASLDHIIPLSKGGTHTYSNVQLTHLSCNFAKKISVLPQGEQLRIF